MRELITLFSRIPIAEEGTSDSAAIGEADAAAFNGEAASLGYTFDTDLLAALRRMGRDAFAELRRTVLAELCGISGASANHAALFNGFPYETPDQRDYWIKRIVGYLQNDLGLSARNYRVLSCGHVIDEHLFDPDAFGACPICQRGVPELWGRETVRHAYAAATPLKILSKADDAFLAAAGGTLLRRASSLSAAEKSFLLGLKGRVALERPAEVYRETLPLAYVLFDDVAYMRGLLASATDVLRIGVFLSDPAADLSLKAPARLRLATRQKKALLGLLESLEHLEEDMLRYRERWLRLGEHLHSGSRENRRRFPRTSAAFDRLRKAPRSIRTFNRDIERGVRANRFDAAFLDRLSERPAEFVRRTDLMLRRAHEPEPILDRLCGLAPRVGTPMLFAMRKYLAHRAGAGRMRVFVPKGGTNQVFVADDRRAPIPDEIRERALAIFAEALGERLSVLPAMGAVHVDPRLDDLVVPFNRRGDSSTSRVAGKGSRYPLSDLDTVRLFVHWTGDVDVDLSVVGYDGAFRRLQVISWQNLAGLDIVHSGDVQSAPEGASEFIDFGIASLLGHGIRYVVASVIVYRGPVFSAFPCFAGFMERDALKSGEKFEPASVRLKFAIAAANRSHMPLIFDLVRRRIVFADMASGRNPFGTAAGQNEKLVATARAVLDLPNLKPTFRDVIATHVAARGHAAEMEGANRVFLAADLDIDACLAEFLA